MKLGATITSERGKPVTKTGNEKLEIVLNSENKDNVRLLFTPAVYKPNCYELRIYHKHGIQVFQYEKDNGSVEQATPRYNSSKDALRCTHTGCKELQTEDIEYCEKHNPHNGSLKHDKEYFECRDCGEDIEIKRDNKDMIIKEDCPHCSNKIIGSPKPHKNTACNHTKCAHLTDICIDDIPF